MNGIHKEILELLKTGLRIVTATVIRTSGSTPQKPGSTALFGEKGLMAGTVGGGILEGEVHHIATKTFTTGQSEQYFFDLDARPGEEGAICGGEAVVLVDANPAKHLKALDEMERSLEGRKGGYLLTAIGRATKQGRTLERYWVTKENVHSLPEKFSPQLMEVLSRSISGSTGSGFKEIELPRSQPSPFEGLFLEAVNPLPRLVIAGAGHVGKALAHIGKLLEFEVTVIDDRPEYANQVNIPDADHLIVQKFGKALGEMASGPDTYIVIVTRGHTQDAEALLPCIGIDAAYVGMIGSTHKVGVLKKRFLSEGLATPAEWSKIQAPIGLDIGSKSVQEIAVSIAAQLVSVRSLKNKENER